jgi:integrase
MDTERVELVSKENEDIYYIRALGTNENQGRGAVRRKFKFTKSSVKALPFCTNAQMYCYDKSFTGFGVRLGQTKKSYFVESDIRGGDAGVRITILDVSKIDLDDARGMAREYILKMRQGIDPREEVKKSERERERKLEERRKKTITLKRAFQEFLEKKRYKGMPLKIGTKIEYLKILNTLFDDWGGISICDITPADIIKKHGEIIEKAQARYKKMHEKKKEDNIKIPDKVGRSYADSAMRTLSSVLNWAMWNLSLDKTNSLFERNPVDILNRNRSGLWYTPAPRDERIHDHQLSLWLTTLDNLRSKNGDLSTIRTGCDYLEFVLFTGLRRNEAANLTWGNFDYDMKILQITDTKNRIPLNLPLTEHLWGILRERKRISGMLHNNKKFVFPSMVKEDGPLAEPRYVAEEVTKISGIKFRIHDLRRTFISIAGILLREPIVKTLVNHKNGDVTSGYQHYDIKERREAMEKISEYIMCKKREGQIKIVNSNAS